MKTSSVTDPHLKDVYAAWLNDLNADDPAKVLKRLQRRTAAAAKHSDHNATNNHRTTKSKLRALQRPTEASASKHVSQRQESKLPPLAPTNVSPETASLQRQEAQRRRHQALADEANCSDYEYRAPLEPGLAFFVLLATTVIRDASEATRSNATSGTLKRKLQSFPIRIPPTLIRTHTRSHRTSVRLVLLFTTHAEQDSTECSSNSLVLHVQEFATEQQYREQRHVLLRLFTGAGEGQQECEGALALNKYASDSCKTNDTFVLTSVEDVAVAMDALWRADSKDADATLWAIQKFVVFKGPSSVGNSLRKAWIARPVYRKKERASWVWILTDSDSSEFTDSHHEGCQIVKCTGSQSWTDPRELAAACNQSFEALLQASFSELVLDLIQDIDGKWWLLQVKAFQVRRWQRRPISAGLSNGEVPAATRKDLESEDRVRSAPERLGCASGEAPIVAVHKKWRCAGKFCSSSGEDNNSLGSSVYISSRFSSSASPSGYLTKKVLLSCEFYDAYMTQRDMSIMSGFGDVGSALAFHLQHQISKRERNQLYESQPLCSACVSKYHFIREQWIVTTGGGSKNQHAAGEMKTRKRSSSSTSFSAATPPRLLPALQGATSASSLSTSVGISSTHQPVMQASYSAPSVLLQTPQNRHHSADVDGSGTGRPEYLSEMDRIEEMLATHDAKFASAVSNKSHVKQPGNTYSPRAVSTTSAACSTGVMDNDNNSGSDSNLDFASKHFSQYLQQRRVDAAESVEEMWKHVSLKPLASSGGSFMSHPPKHAYNTLSVASELEKQQLAERNNHDGRDEGAKSSLHDLEKDLSLAKQPKRSSLPSDSNNQRSSTSAAPVHTISIQNCREVFYDEAFRDRVVSEAREQLQLNNSVRVVVMPSSTLYRGVARQAGGDSAQNNLPPYREHLDDEDERELAEMALRTLFLDLSQSAPECIASLFKSRPDIVREASGCTTLAVTQVSSQANA